MERKTTYAWKKEELEEDIPIFKKSLLEYKKMVKNHEEEFNNALLKNFGVLKLKIKKTKNKLAFNVQELPPALKEEYDLLKFEKQEVKRKTTLLKSLNEKLALFKTEDEKKSVEEKTPAQNTLSNRVDTEKLLDISNSYFYKPTQSFDEIINERVQFINKTIKKNKKKQNEKQS